MCAASVEGMWICRQCKPASGGRTTRTKRRRRFVPGGVEYGASGGGVLTSTERVSTQGKGSTDVKVFYE